MIVADTNLIAYLLIEGEHTVLAERVFEADSHWIAPRVWASELRNVLALTVRASGLDLDDALALWIRAETLLGDCTFAAPAHEVLTLAAGSPCSAYDCEFVVLAERSAVPFITSGRRVLAAFPDIAMSPTRFLDE